MIADIKKVKELLEKYDVHPKKMFGQNFLVDRASVDKIIGEVSENSSVLEIGPGLGSLTEPLLDRCFHVTSYEIDKDMAGILNDIFAERSNFTLINEDFLKCDLSKYQGQKMTLVSNLPYYITSDLLEMILCHSELFDKIIVMTQKEVADKFVKRDNNKDRGPLNVLAEYLCDISPVTKVDRHCFYPAPNVDSAVFALKIKEADCGYRDGFYAFIKKCFSQRRKTLASNLKGYYPQIRTVLEKMGIDPLVRSEELSVDVLRKLFEEFR